MLLYRYSDDVAILLDQEAELADYIDNADQISIKEDSNFVFFQVRRLIDTILLLTHHIYRVMTVRVGIILSYQNLSEILLQSKTFA